MKSHIEREIDMCKLGECRDAGFVASRVLCKLALLTVVARELPAQSMWVNQQQKGGLALEYLRPAFDGDPDYSLLTGAYIISVRAPMSDRVRLVAELPIVHLSYKSSLFGDQSEDALGNPYLGVATGSPDSGTLIEAGAHLPLAGAGDGGLLLGYFADYDRFELYVPNTASIGVLVGQKSRSRNGTFSHLRFGPSAHIPTGGGGGDTEVTLAYGLAGGFENQAGSVALGFSGRWLVTGDGGSFGDNSINQATLALSHDFARVRVGAQLRIPLSDQISDVIKHVVGLNLSVPFR